jgi:hypothetical protein
VTGNKVDLELVDSGEVIGSELAGKVLVIRRASTNPPFEGEIESLSQIAEDL